MFVRRIDKVTAILDPGSPRRNLLDGGRMAGEQRGELA
jgi:hypothetical protein